MTLLGEPEVLRQQAQRSTALTLKPGKSPAHTRVVKQQGRRHAGIFLEQRKEVRPRQTTSPRGVVDRVRIIEVLEQPGGATAHPVATNAASWKSPRSVRSGSRTV